MTLFYDTVERDPLDYEMGILVSLKATGKQLYKKIAGKQSQTLVLYYRNSPGIYYGPGTDGKELPESDDTLTNIGLLSCSFLILANRRQKPLPSPGTGPGARPGSSVHNDAGVGAGAHTHARPDAGGSPDIDAGADYGARPTPTPVTGPRPGTGKASTLHPDSIPISPPTSSPSTVGGTIPDPILASVPAPNPPPIRTPALSQNLKVAVSQGPGPGAGAGATQRVPVVTKVGPTVPSKTESDEPHEDFLVLQEEQFENVGTEAELLQLQQELDQARKRDQEREREKVKTSDQKREQAPDSRIDSLLENI